MVFPLNVPKTNRHYSCYCLAARNLEVDGQNTLTRNDTIKPCDENIPVVGLIDEAIAATFGIDLAVPSRKSLFCITPSFSIFHLPH